MSGEWSVALTEDAAIATAGKQPEGPQRRKLPRTAEDWLPCAKRRVYLKRALAEAVGIPQRTVSFYEREGGYLPSTLVPNFAKALGVSMEELLGIDNGSQRSKRGPKSQLERQLEAIATLPRNQQQKILAVVEAMIAHHAER